MECKASRQCRKGALVPVLIETSWNVKFAGGPRVFVMKGVLIETSWNVKDANSAIFAAANAY